MPGENDIAASSVVGPVALVAGASGLVLMLEVLAGRLMAPYVGVSQETFTGIIGTVLAGIAAGASIGGRLADRRDPRSLIGPALAAGGLLTWATLPVVRMLGPLVGSGPVAIVVLAAAAFLPPALVLSAIAPMVAKLQLDSLDQSGEVVGRVSAAGTVGALVGTFLTGYVLVTALPTQWIVIIIGAVAVLAGLVMIGRSGSKPVSTGTAVVLLVVPGFGAAFLPPPCDHESAYFCIRVERDPERPSGRSLILDQTRHAYVDVDDPSHLELRYVRLIADVVSASLDGPVDALHIGGGGFTLPAYLDATRPGSSNVVFEIDPALVDVARTELGLDVDAVDVRVGDARLAFDGVRDDSFDVVIGDAFASTSVPWHLTTTELMSEIGRVLRPGGIYVMNVIDGGRNRFARAQLATLREEFEHVAVIVPEGGVPDGQGVNQILVGSDVTLEPPAIATGDGQWIAGAALDEFIDGARPLRDDFAPVDQLLLR